ncbi:hypothetical protein ISS07_01825 [Candidatus Woesearchaeota archaeon]|nr:hypothetical protein [Candidatus Woesearchaeota archaeon]
MGNKLKDILVGKVTKKEIGLIPNSFDVIGQIMVFSNFPEELKKKEKIIGKGILEHHKNIISVFKKSENYSGKYRTPKLALLAGINSKETEHKENNTRIKLNVEKVYFSVRLSTERKRIFEQVKKNEEILAMFSGCGVYPLTIVKNSDAKKIIGIEANPTGHKFALENLKINKIEDKIKLYKGDVRKILPDITKKFDRILMPLPKGAERFLDITLKKIKEKGTIHLYTFSEEGKFDDTKKNIREECKKQGKKCRILKIVKCGHYSPGTFRVCVDFRVSSL